MTSLRIHTGHHGWLLRCATGQIIVRMVKGAPEPSEHMLKQSKGDPGGLCLVVYGRELGSDILDQVDRAVAGGIQIRQGFAAVLVQQIEDRFLHRALKQIDCVLDYAVIDLGRVSVSHRFISSNARIAACARRAVSRSIMDDAARIASASIRIDQAEAAS